MNRVLFVIFGLFTGFLAPVLWVVWRGLTTRWNWWVRFVAREWMDNSDMYIAIGAGSMVILAIVGYFIGGHYDDLELITNDARDSKDELSEMAFTDGLTRVFNHRYIYDRLDTAMDYAYQSPLSCLLIDIDHFKKINDTYGHPFGDVVLVRVASILKSTVRRLDVVGRLGGEEFIVLLPDTPEDRAVQAAERIRKEIQAELIEIQGKKICLTVSVGVATKVTKFGQTKEDFVKAADEALYHAKNTGRNRTAVWTEPPARAA